MLTLPRLTLPPDQMRAAGDRAIELIIERMNEGEFGPVLVRRSRDDLENNWDEPLPDHGRDLVDLLERLAVDALPSGMHSDHPRCFAFVPTSGNYPAVLADALATAFLSVPGAWLVGSGPTQLELVTLRWLRELLDLDAHFGGLFVSGGSIANLTALTAARDSRLGGDLTAARAYCSTQAHPSIARALHIIGLRRDQLVVLPPDDRLRLNPARVAERIRSDRSDGWRPFLVVATIGTTSTGAVDPIEELADVCEREQVWLHADGAFGAAAAATDRGRRMMAGLNRVDSLTLDPHKWLFQPYELGCVLLRRPEQLKETFAMARHFLDSGYLTAAESDGREPNLSDYGPQQTRGLRALKLWLSLKTFGANAFRDAIDQGMTLAEHAAVFIDNHPELEPTSEPGLGIVTFRYRPPTMAASTDLDSFHTELARTVLEAGFAMITTTRVRGRIVLRMCTINPRTSAQHVDDTLGHIVNCGRFLAARADRSADADRDVS
ncbi:pyridoxal phosphate-dependent decarboxylase family protein [Nocardia pseudobrasiliensis]|uniref:Glutamate/tyrosine decarboxylase-like PLP-dependent enzyme n=1 Tax=Nocardia pseudobrasiliensis TaxID=45979 RepID=A0A370I512_9NOCA|nr:pyridoxal-dependent decarboxylase [Nocardia pseudobrasiliensis]RDI65836.1 glutamate/tyrosine decarboxylase-like PLP-dependent enzyme [Nocardia pseudobrasiliensis]